MVSWNRARVTDGASGWSVPGTMIPQQPIRQREHSLQVVLLGDSFAGLAAWLAQQSPCEALQAGGASIPPAVAKAGVKASDRASRIAPRVFNGANLPVIKLKCERF
jgi:hypothetical protein